MAAKRSVEVLFKQPIRRGSCRCQSVFTKLPEHNVGIWFNRPFNFNDEHMSHKELPDSDVSEIRQ